ncbi:outer membrane beta-barrel domain-containing protein [Bradymonas sediminis]|nr:outer membrane beta-barrel domain-containing protein [Bradymonas sediminis]TDP77181.1 outer membrane beta-barrel protein [Bradymonas sediminis]
MTLLPYPERSAQTRRRLRTLMMALLVGGLLSVSGNAFAQDDAAENDVDAVSATSDDSAEEAAAPSAPVLQLAGGDRSAIETKMDSFWSVKKDLSSVEGRKYTREGKFRAGLYTGILSSQPFYWYIPVGLRATYFLSDNFGVGIEGSFSGATSFNTELSDYLEGARPTDFTEAKKEDRFLWRAHAVATWHPLYGKLAFLQRKLTHFDLNLVAGLGAVGVDRPNAVQTQVDGAVAPELLLGGGVDIFLTESVTVQLDGRFYIYQAAENDINNGDFFQSLDAPSEFLLGVSYLF